jgi:hypothetical protein
MKADTKSKAKHCGQPYKELRVNSSNPTQTFDGITSINYKVITANKRFRRQKQNYKQALCNCWHCPMQPM